MDQGDRNIGYENQDDPLMKAIVNCHLRGHKCWETYLNLWGLKIEMYHDKSKSELTKMKEQETRQKEMKKKCRKGMR
jgi:hypothetical protein